MRAIAADWSKRTLDPDPGLVIAEVGSAAHA
jgi:hypothetical protein